MASGEKCLTYLRSELGGLLIVVLKVILIFFVIILADVKRLLQY